MPALNLKTILVIDAVTCAGIFLISLFAAVPVAALLGLPTIIVTVGGWICLASALLMFAVAAQTPPNPALTRLIAVGNLGWVAASFAVIAVFAGPMGMLGVAVVAVQALAVLAFAILEARGATVIGRAATA